ncbi:MAG TPA: alpha-amylase, partial [Candidatus Aminicenantes bacterium]|nr:alpha-amylase [Candidatus Aminicenantes bacterium]
MNHPLRVALPRISASQLAEGGLTREFHISRFCREKYHFDEALFTQSGNVVFADFHAVRTFVARVNHTRDLIAQPETALHAGAVNAMGLIDEILHIVFQLYGEEVDRTVGGQALRFLEERVGREAMGQVLSRFASEFPPLAVTRGEMTASQYAADESRRQLLLEELVMLWLANENPAFSPYRELFDDGALTAETVYPRLFPLLAEFFTTHPPFGPDEQPLLEMLRTPALVVPHSLPGQLQYIRERWGLI